MPERLDTLTSYAPALITRRLASNPSPLSEPLAERFSAAVLFADITGFTPLTERLGQHGLVGAEELSRILKDYFGPLTLLIHEHSGDVVKFAGDALLATPVPVYRPLREKKAVVRIPTEMVGVSTCINTASRPSRP